VFAGLYYFSGRARKTAAPQTPAGKPSVAETTVDLPKTTTPTPPVQTPPLPAPTPSRPASGAAIEPDARPPATLTGRLLIRSTPANADVTVNGQPRGKTPITMRDLPLGSYNIHIEHEGYEPDQRRVDLSARQTMSALSFSLKPVAAESGSGTGSLDVQSRPPGAQVFVNDRLVGRTPLSIRDMPAGPAAVRIEVEGFRTWTTTVHIEAGKPARVNASLDR
jgi:hypothetical protein